MKPVRTPGRATQRSQELAIIRTPDSERVTPRIKQLLQKPSMY